MEDTVLTSHCTTSTTLSMVIDHNGIALNYAVEAEIAAETSIGDFPILENFDGHFHSIDS